MGDDAQGELQRRYDALIVGAGIAGLVAGALLARAGERVLILERRDVPGGSSAPICRGPWSWDFGTHYLGDANDGGVFRRVLDLCGAGSVEFSALDEAFEEVTVDDDVYHYYRNRSRSLGFLRTRFPQERYGIERYRAFLEQAEHYERTSSGKNPLSLAIRLLRNPEFARYSSRGLGDLLDACSNNRTLRTVLCAQHLTYLDDPARIAAGLHASMQNHLFRTGAWYPTGGMSALTSGLENAFLDAGGTLAYRATVERIRVENRTAVGVDVRFAGEENTESIDAPVVVSNADIYRTVTQYTSARNHRAADIQRISAESMSFPVVTLHLGLAIDPEEAPFRRRNYWWYQGVNLDRYYEQLRFGIWPERLLAFISSESAKGSAHAVAPPGHSTLSIMTPAPPRFSSWGLDVEITASPDDIGAGMETEAYREVCAKVQQRLRRIAIQQFPEIEGKIVTSYMTTPPSHAFESGAIGGSVFGLTGRPEHYEHNRPGRRTDVLGLYLTGSSTRPGFVPVGASISGVLTAEAVLGTGLRQDLFG